MSDATTIISSMATRQIFGVIAFYRQRSGRIVTIAAMGGVEHRKNVRFNSLRHLHSLALCAGYFLSFFNRPSGLLADYKARCVRELARRFDGMSQDYAQLC